MLRKTLVVLSRGIVDSHPARPPPAGSSESRVDAAPAGQLFRRGVHVLFACCTAVSKSGSKLGLSRMLLWLAHWIMLIVVCIRELITEVTCAEA